MFTESFFWGFVLPFWTNSVSAVDGCTGGRGGVVSLGYSQVMFQLIGCADIKVT